jgi:hypothetical protein
MRVGGRFAFLEALHYFRRMKLREKMRRYAAPILIAPALLGLALALNCGLKGPPIPKGVAASPGPRPGAGMLQFGPKAEKTPPEEDLILKLYRKDEKKDSLPGADDALGTGAWGVGAPAETWMDKQGQETAPMQTPANASPTPTPAPDAAPSSEPQEKDEP